MNAPPFPPFPTSPRVGQRFGTWVWNGAQWIPSQTSGTAAIITVFKASGVYQPSLGLSTALVECFGAGGSGGWVAAGTFTGGIAAGGGASGEYARAALDASLVAGGVVVTIGQGAQTVIGVDDPSAYRGGDTSFGGLVVARGGSSANPTDPANSYYGAPGNINQPSQGIGDVVFYGAPGQNWGTIVVNAVNMVRAGSGGTLLGGAWATGYATGTNSPGFAGQDNSGAGGSGAWQLDHSAQLGGRGGSGVCIVTEYCSVGGAAGGAPVSIANCGPGWGGPC